MIIKGEIKMENKINQIRTEAIEKIEKTTNLKELEEVKNQYLSRNSEFNNLKKSMKDLTPEQKPVIGALINKVSNELNTLVAQKNDLFYKKELNEKLLKEKIDITMDGDYIPLGHVHPLTRTVNEIV